MTLQGEIKTIRIISEQGKGLAEFRKSAAM